MPATVLCVDDDRAFCQILAKALTSEGYDVRTAFDGEEALKAVVEGHPQVVLLDLILPRRDGFAVLEAIRSESEPVRDTAVFYGAAEPYQRRSGLPAMGIVEGPGSRRLRIGLYTSTPDGTPIAEEDSVILRGLRAGEMVNVHETMLWRRAGSALPVQG